MDCSTPGFPVLHHLPEPAQTHVHWVGDAIQPSHPLLPSSPPALCLPSIRVFSSELALLIRGPKYWSLSFSISPSNEYSAPISFRIDWFDLAVQGTLKNLLHLGRGNSLWRWSGWERMTESREQKLRAFCMFLSEAGAVTLILPSRSVLGSYVLWRQGTCLVFKKSLLKEQ